MKLVSPISLALFAVLLACPFAFAQEGVEQEMDEAKTQYRSGNYQAAIGALNRVIDEAPDRADAYYLIGYSHFMLRQYSESLDAFARAFQLEPTLDPRAIFGRRSTQ